MINQNIKVRHLYKMDNGGQLKAFADIVIEDTFLIKDLRIIDGKNGLFVDMPRKQGKDGQWYQTVLPLNKEIKQQVNEIVLQAYEEQ